MMFLALATSFAVPWARRRNLSDLSAASYFTTLSLGIPMLYSPAPSALTPPTTTAPSSAPIIHATNGPADQYRPNPWDGEKRGAEQHSPNPSPESAEFAPVLHAVAGIIVTATAEFVVPNRYR